MAWDLTMCAGAKIQVLRRLPRLGLAALLLSCWLGEAAVLAQEKNTYVSQKNDFSFQYPAAYKLTGAGDYLDFRKNSKTFCSVWVENRFIEMLYQMLHPGIVMHRPGEDPYLELAQASRKDKDLFRRYARQVTKGWCSADGPDGSVYCQDFQNEKSFTSRSGFDCLEIYPIMIREDIPSKTKNQKMVGPVFAVYLPKTDLPVLLMLAPLQGQMATPAQVQEMREIIDSLKTTQ